MKQSCRCNPRSRISFICKGELLLEACSSRPAPTPMFSHQGGRTYAPSSRALQLACLPWLMWTTHASPPPPHFNPGYGEAAVRAGGLAVPRVPPGRRRRRRRRRSAGFLLLGSCCCTPKAGQTARPVQCLPAGRIGAGHWLICPPPHKYQ